MAQVDKIDVGNWVNYFDFNSAEDFLMEILNEEVDIEKMKHSVLAMRDGDIDMGEILMQEMYYEEETLTDLNNESEWDRHARHMKPINKAREMANE
jgi:hypothetical protein